MKRFYSLLCAGLLAWTTFSACQKEEAPLLPQPVAQTASCEESATIKANDCGFFLQMDNGSMVYATSYRGFDMKEGTQVQFGYELPYDNSHASSSGSGQCGDSGMDDPDPSSLEGCMRTNGVSQVRITCLQAASPSPTSE